FFFSCSVPHRDLHSFPTRRSSDLYPELVRAETLIAETLQLEEKNFHRTLERGLALLEAEAAKLGDGQVFSGDVAFTLYDTYGFPDRKSTRLNSSHVEISYAVFCLK